MISEILSFTSSISPSSTFLVTFRYLIEAIAQRQYHHISACSSLSNTVFGHSFFLLLPHLDGSPFFAFFWCSLWAIAEGENDVPLLLRLYRAYAMNRNRFMETTWAKLSTLLNLLLKYSSASFRSSEVLILSWSLFQVSANFLRHCCGVFSHGSRGGLQRQLQPPLS